MRLMLVVLLLSGCTVQLSPDDDLVRRVGVLEDQARRVDGWSQGFAQKVGAELTAHAARLKKLEGPKGGAK